MKQISLHQRAAWYNESHSHLPPLVVHNNKDGKSFLYGYFFLGSQKQSAFYGAYANEYLNRMTCLFFDAKKIVRLFSGSMPASSAYVRVGIDPTGQYKPDIEGDAEQLSSFLPFKPDLIYADPPYTEQEAETKYQISLVNGPKVLSECAAVLQPGGFVVWLDTRLPVFSNDELSYVGCISYIRSTGNRFRCIALFQKPV